MKIDLEFDDRETTVYTSLILYAKHPLLQQIVGAYQQLILQAGDDDK